jgi:hypothetical protein
MLAAQENRNDVRSLVHERLRLLPGERERIEMQNEVTLPNGQRLTLLTEQFLMVRKHDIYFVTMKTPLDQQRKYQSIFEIIGRGFRFKG